MTDEQKQEEVRQKYIELQLLKQQLKQVEKQLQALAQQEVELEATRQNLDEIGMIQQGAEVLVPVASGIFMRTAAKNAQELIVNVGAGTALPKNIPEVKRILGEQVQEISKLQEDLSSQAQEMAREAQKAEQELRQMVE